MFFCRSVCSSVIEKMTSMGTCVSLAQFGQVSSFSCIVSESKQIWFDVSKTSYNHIPYVTGKCGFGLDGGVFISVASLYIHIPCHI